MAYSTVKKRGYYYMKIYCLLSLFAVCGAATSNSFHRELQDEVVPLPRPVPVPGPGQGPGPVPVDTHHVPLRSGIAERISTFSHALRDGLGLRNTGSDPSLPSVPDHSYHPSVERATLSDLPRYNEEHFREGPYERGTYIPSRANIKQEARVAPLMGPNTHSSIGASYGALPPSPEAKQGANYVQMS